MADLDPVSLLEVLTRHRVRFVVVGAVAAISQGYPLPTEDLDITPARDAQNLQRLAKALEELGARLRVSGEPDGVEFPIDAETLAQNEMWTLTTAHGDLDLMFVPAGTRGFEDLRRDATTVELGDERPVRVPVASLADVIRSKEAANRPKDRAQLPALRQTLELIRQRQAREA